MHDLVDLRSAAQSPLRQVKYLYHFTDERNIAWIRALSGLHSLLKLQGYSRLVGIELPPAPGGDPKSHWLDKKLGLNEYVHLCFLPIHPMEVQARKEGRIHDPVFLQVHRDVLHQPGVLFAPDIANKAGVSLCPIEQAVSGGVFDSFVDADLSDAQTKRQLQHIEKYELLVPNSVPLDLIINLPDN